MNSGNLSFAVQSKLPLSTITPPTCTACPSIYLVVECITISAPNSIGRQRIGVANVLSTIRGTPFLWAILANFSISNTVSAGFARVSPKIAFVLGLNAFWISSSEAFGSTHIHSIPNFLSVTENRFTVPPYIVETDIKLSPAEHILRIEIKVAACPLLVNIAPTPPSRAAIFSSTALQVGFEKREYIHSVGISKSSAICSVESNQ